MVAEEVGPDWPPPAYDPSEDPKKAPGRSIWVVAALVVLVCLGAVAVFVFGGDDQDPRAARSEPSPTNSPPAPTTIETADSPSTPCGPDQATALSEALGRVPPDRRTGKPWDRNPASSNYNACADLSAIVVTVQDGTSSSPDLALMFHRGAFVGTATPTAYPFTELEAPASTNDTVVLTYRTRQSCSTCTDGTLTIVGFQWKGDKVQMLDSPPEALDAPP